MPSLSWVPHLQVLVVGLLLLAGRTTTTLVAAAAGGSDNKCAASTSFECPHLTELCNATVYVSDCLEECDGYRNTDPTNEVCFDRKLLSAKNNPKGSGILWRDIIGIIVWFCAAGIATACGVGGGGIYVPLGILLLNFAPKPSSGLSQASIFGASLGGLLLNLSNVHPNMTKVRVVHKQQQQQQQQQQKSSSSLGGEDTATTDDNNNNNNNDDDDDNNNKMVYHYLETLSIPTTETTQATTKNGESVSDDASSSQQHTSSCYEYYYKRPLIDYDMALFLAPMEMAGAVLGVLIQKILPNWLYLTLAAIILGFTAFKTYRKFLETRKKEQQQSSSQEPEGQVAGDGTKHNHKQELKHPNNDVAAAAAEDEQDAASHTVNTAEKTEDTSKDDLNEFGGIVHFQNLATGTAAGGDGGTTTASNEIILLETVTADDQQQQQQQQQLSAIEVATGMDLLPDASIKEEEGDVEVVEEPKELTAQQQQQQQQRAEVNDQTLERLQYWLEQDQRQFPAEKLMGLLVLWIGLILLTFFKGGKGVDSIVGITCASPWYGALIAIQFIWTFGFAALYGYKLLVATNDKQACGYPFHPHDVQWDLSKIRFYSFFTFVAGIVAGLIGIGGGMVLGPLMLIMGIHPRVSSATTATMIVLTSSSVAVLFVTAGLVPWEYAITFFCVCFVGACVGKTKIDGYVKRTGKASLLILLLATIIALATIGCIVIVLTRLAAADWCFAGFNQFCSISAEDMEESEEMIACPVVVEDRMLSAIMSPPSMH